MMIYRSFKILMCLITLISINRSEIDLRIADYNYDHDPSDSDLYKHQFYENTSWPHLMVCKGPQITEYDWRRIFSPNYHASSLLVNSNDTEDVVLCPGDYIGDLNSTYLVLRLCTLILYQNGQAIWFSNEWPYNDVSKWYSPGQGDFVCAAALQRDGNFVLYREFFIQGQIDYRGFTSIETECQWDAGTDFNPMRTELRIAGQQLQMIQIFEDGSEKSFVPYQSFEKFREIMGLPRQVAGDTIIKDHDDEDKIILKRNEYFGDLIDLHLILRPDCTLELLNGTRAIWSYTPYYRTKTNCALNIVSNFLAISTGDIRETGMRSNLEENEIIMPKSHYLLPVKSEFILKDDQLLIRQILSDETSLTFYTRPGVNNGLVQKREFPKRILLGPHLSFESLKFERMDYVGNLDGIHLMLKDDCTFVFSDKSEILWISEPDKASMECSVPITPNGYASLFLRYNHFRSNHLSLQKECLYNRWSPKIRFHLTEASHSQRITLDLVNPSWYRSQRIFYAGLTTESQWIEILDIEAHNNKK